MKDSCRRWPAFSSPKKDELLSSWVVRLAMSHGLKLHTFCSVAWPHKSIWNRDIDKSADADLIEVLREKTGVPRERVSDTTLATYEGRLYEKHNPYGNTPWIMPVGIYHRTRRQFGLQFCPACLAGDAEPYFRREWRLAFITYCRAHKVLLSDRCPKCSAAVNFHRDELGDRNKIVADSMTLCHACKFDLRDAAADEFVQPVRESDVEFQRSLTDGVQKGWVEISEREAVYSHLYFTGLHQLMRVLATGKRAAVLRDAVSRECGVESFTPTFNTKKRDVERLPVEDRHKLLILARHLLSDWPHRLAAICTATRVWSATLLRDLEPAPFWYWRAVHDHLYRVSYQPSDQEIKSVIRQIEKSGGIPFKKAISQRMGVNDAFRKRKTDGSFLITSHPCPRNLTRRQEVQVVRSVGGEGKC